MNKKTKKYAILFLISVYAMPVLMYILPKEVVLFSLLFPMLTGIVNIVVVIKNHSNDDWNQLFQSALLIKYALIPFFIIGTAIVIFSVFLTFIPVPIMIFVGPILIIIELCIGWFVLAFSSPYMIGYLVVSGRNGSISRKACILCIILQFFFVADFVSAIWLHIQKKKMI